MSNSTPGLVYKQVPTAGQWNGYFGTKQDWNAILDAVIAAGGAPGPGDVTAETARAEAAEGVNATAIAAETTRATAAEGTNATNIASEITNRGAAIAAEVTARNAAIALIAAPRGQLGGLGLSNDATLPNTVLDIAAGAAADSTAAVVITLGAFTKSIAGTWVAGSAANGMGSGLTATLNTWYHVFAIIVGGVADIYFDTSITAANKPASTTAFRRIGSIRLDGSVHILPFSQTADRFDWVTPVVEYNGTPGVTTAVTVTLAGVPPGVAVQALLSGIISDTAQSAFYASSLAQADISPSSVAALTTSVAANGVAGFNISISTNASSQIRRRSNSTSQTVTILNNGWIDMRGRG